MSQKGKRHVMSGGGTRSEKAPMYHLVPPEGPRRTAIRFALGAELHGPENWKRSCEDEESAREWCDEAYNHMMEHMLKMGASQDPQDDHLGAIGWGQAVLAYCEAKYEKPWTQLGIVP